MNVQRCGSVDTSLCASFLFFLKGRQNNLHSLLHCIKTCFMPRGEVKMYRLYQIFTVPWKSNRHYASTTSRDSCNNECISYQPWQWIWIICLDKMFVALQQTDCIWNVFRGTMQSIFLECNCAWLVLWSLESFIASWDSVHMMLKACECKET